jgi:hypothetical protein
MKFISRGLFAKPSGDSSVARRARGEEKRSWRRCVAFLSVFGMIHSSLASQLSDYPVCAWRFAAWLIARWLSISASAKIVPWCFFGASGSSHLKIFLKTQLPEQAPR